MPAIYALNPYGIAFFLYLWWGKGALFATGLFNKRQKNYKVMYIV